ncbi:SMP-30/gluconolactonase/LRE family protein [Brevifollis gellanilyticus]|uniref:Gluconolactonase n=1 Tax=Brevifollis gellanilyticus TaxID=748831 RepID=A0A512M9C9_9BACT|nr:SMP-30/gluconolactonase/LRE family protein [Brevifollis gellanilyticus]GEP43336.1 gluconolactonase [Brevifollis gellanilyticus]
MRLLLLPLFLLSIAIAAEPEFPLTADSQPQAGVPKGTMLKDSYKARDGSVFPGTEREYQIYLPAGHDKTKPAAFMVFQDGVIYQAPVVFDNLIARKDMPPLVGIFIKPGVVPAANENALPRYNRSYEYDSITPTYSEFLIDEFLPAIESKHGLKLSTDPNQSAISGNSSGGICAFMVAWHRPDRFRRVFTGVGTYVGIHGADQLPVLVRKFEPKPLRVFLQSGTGDNNLYCGDWWMANQMMERSLTWAGYDVNHAWGEGGHNQKHASQIFPEVLRWLWRDWQTTMEVKANPRGDSKWKGYEVVGDGEWKNIASFPPKKLPNVLGNSNPLPQTTALATSMSGEVYILFGHEIKVLPLDGPLIDHAVVPPKGQFVYDIAIGNDNQCHVLLSGPEDYLPKLGTFSRADKSHIQVYHTDLRGESFCIGQNQRVYVTSTLRQTYNDSPLGVELIKAGQPRDSMFASAGRPLPYGGAPAALTLSPDQTQLYAVDSASNHLWSFRLDASGKPSNGQIYHLLDEDWNGRTEKGGLCVDTNGWLYVATSLGIQVLDQAGRVNFIIPTPKAALDVCFGGKDLSELFIACGDTIYKRATKAKGVVSGQQAPIKPPAPKL